MKKKSILFTPIKINTVTIPNRFVRSATHDFLAANDGYITERQISLYRNLGKGEVGLIITGHAFVHPAGKASPYQIGVHDDGTVEGLNRITQAVHEFPARIFLQIAHAGRQTKEKLCGCTPLAPSAVYEPVFKITPKEMTIRDIKAVITQFIQAGVRAKQAGFDGVQLHVAHGYLLSGFVSPYTNKRNDEYGGSLTNRAKIVLEIVKGIKKSAGEQFPLILKMNATDSLKGGLTTEESIQLGTLLEKIGVDGIEVSGGMAESGEGSVWKGLRSENDEGYFVDAASRIKEAVRVPVFGLGGIRTFSNMESLILEGRVDMISMSRPFIRQPFLVREFRLDRFKKAECISCNKCFNPRGISCGDLKSKKKTPKKD
ncbi:MAG: NADH:flavin oxidoreductase [Candidatus Aminicenantaceae bacterium]